MLNGSKNTVIDRQLKDQRALNGNVCLSGDVIHLRVFGQSIVVLNSLCAVGELFEKRSANYSDRLQTEMMTL